MPRRSRRLITRREEADLVPHAGVADLRHAQARLDPLGKDERPVEPAGRLHHQADHLARGELEQPPVDQPAVHQRVEVGVVGRVVDVPVDVVVRPARGDGQEMRVARAGLAHHDAPRSSIDRATALSTGGEKKNPCAAPQPTSRKKPSCSAVSTPSAMTGFPRSRASDTIVRTNSGAEPLGDPPLNSDRSIFKESNWYL